jgi:hypothetical protein
MSARFETDRLPRCNYIHASALYRRSVWEQNRGYDGICCAVDDTCEQEGLENVAFS